MAHRKEAIKTEIKYEVTSCYFCNEFLTNDKVKSHIEQCGAVSQKCPFGCSAYLQRKHIEQHVHEWPRRIIAENGNSLSVESLHENEQNIIAIRNALNEEIRQRNRLITDIGDLRRKYQSFEDWIDQIDKIHCNLAKSVQNEINNRECEIESIQKNVHKLGFQYREMKEWRTEFRAMLDQYYEDVKFRNDVATNFETLFGDKDTTITKLKSLENEITNVKRNLKQTHSEPVQPTATNGCNSCSNLERKLAETTLELRQMKNIVCETEDKYDKIANIATNVEKDSAATKQELSDFIEHLRNEKKISSFVNSDGHLIWRIDEYAARLKNGKKNDIVLKSPIFCDRPYGYSLRMDVILDGFGTWKGRNLLACVTVVPGEWDPLLSWPCKLKADIV